MVLVVIGAVFLIGAGFWRSLPNGLRMFAAFLGGAVVLAGALFMLSVPLLAKNAKAISPPVSLQIRVSGQPGLRFQGSWAISTLGGSSSGGALEGLTPRLYTISQPGDLGVELRRISQKGDLVVEVLVNGKVAAKASTRPGRSRVFVSYTSDGVNTANG